jgi:hypothetical protein
VLVHRSAGLGGPSEEALATLAELAHAVGRRIPELCDRLVVAVGSADEGYAGHEVVPQDDLWQSARENFSDILGAIADLSERPPAFAAAGRTGKRRAEQGLPLESLLRAYRIGGRIIWEALLEEARSSNTPHIDRLMEGAVIVWELIDVQSKEVSDTYRRAEAETLSRDATRRQALLQSILSGTASQGDLALAPKVLDLPGSGPYVVAVAGGVEKHWLSRDPADALAAAGIASSWLVRAEQAVGIIAIADHSVDEVKATMSASAPARVGLSPPVAELDQIAGGFILADLALRSIPIGRQRVGALDDHLSAALLVASPQLARRLAHRVLGPMAELPAWESEILLRTLRTYLDLGGSVASVATATHCHRNTVMHRMRRIGDLTGLSAAHPDQAGELRLALLATELLEVEPQQL